MLVSVDLKRAIQREKETVFQRICGADLMRGKKVTAETFLGICVRACWKMVVKDYGYVQSSTTVSRPQQFMLNIMYGLL